MPMLERTAATLEPCSLHKVLPSVPRSARSRRQLSTAFWNHGAASVELFDACQALLGGDMDELPPDTDTIAVDPAVPTKGAGLMTASTFLLDFLYPKGTLSLLRKLSCNPLDRYEKPSFRLGSPLARFQVAALSNTASTGAPAQEKAGVTHASSRYVDEVTANSDGGGLKDESEPGHTAAGASANGAPKSFEDMFAVKLGVKSLDDLPTNGRRKNMHKVDGKIFDDSSKASEDVLAVRVRTQLSDHRSLYGEEADEDDWASGPSAKKVYRSFGEIFESRRQNEEEFSDPEKLKKALSRGSSAFPDHIWHLYEHLNPDLRDEYTLDVLRYLAVAPWIPEPRAFCEMVSRLDTFAWSQELVKAAIRTALTLDDVPAATDYFNRALNIRAWPQGFDLLLAHGLTKSSWEELLEVWDISRERLLSDDVPKAGLHSTIKIRDLSAALSAFWEHIRSTSHGTNYESLKDSYDSLLRYILTEAVEFLAMDDAGFIVKHLADPTPYEEVIKLCVRRNDDKWASELYKSYRKLPGVKIRIPVLREMLEVFYPNNDYGMEMVLKDWYSRYENLDYIAYRRYICFYAGQGDVPSVVRLWKEYKRLYKSKAIADRRAVRALIDVHAVRGDVTKARAVFDEVTVGRGRRPDTMQYNMLLAAHDKAWDLDGALETFQELCENTTPNNYSFGYLMKLTGSQGNLPLTLGLYRMARVRGIAPDVALIDAMVVAYCQSDRMDSAEKLCSIAAERRVLPEEITYSGRVTTPYTIIWNTVLRFYAVRHDLRNVNRVLEHINELKIPYDGKTYEYLLQALVLCKQANHALKLVELAEEKGIFVPTAEHYLLLMSGYLATREPAAVMKISRLMTQKNYAESAEKMTKLMQAFGQWTQLPRGARLGTPASMYLEAALATFRQSLGREDRTARDDVRTVAEQYSKMIDILTQMREFANITEIMALYESQFPEHSAPQHLPLKLLNALMRADLQEEKFDAVMEAWDVAFAKVLAMGAHAAVPDVIPAEQQQGGDPNKVAPAHRFLLNEPLSVVLQVHGATGDADGLVSTVAKVREAGFALSGQNWNRYIQLLARFGRWQDAFLLCEQVLMPQWPGWAQRRKKLRQKVRLPLDLRRLGAAYRHARPNTHTLLLLIRHFMQLEQLAPWSSEPARLLERVHRECPRFVRAAKTMMPTGSELEVEILGKKATGAREEGDEEILRYIMRDDEFASVEEGGAAAGVFEELGESDASS